EVGIVAGIGIAAVESGAWALADLATNEEVTEGAIEDGLQAAGSAVSAMALSGATRVAAKVVSKSLRASLVIGGALGGKYAKWAQGLGAAAWVLHSVY